MTSSSASTATTSVTSATAVESEGLTSDAPTEWPGARRARRIASNQYGTCVIKPDRKVACFGDPSPGGAAGEYEEISGSGYIGSDLCGLRTDGTLKCFVGGVTYDHVPKEGSYKNVFLSIGMGCAQRPDDTLNCWGQPEEPEWLNVPTEPLSRVSFGGNTGCAYTGQGALVCWGREGLSEQSRLMPDKSTYVALYFGGQACGLEEGGSIGCWALPLLGLELPPGAGFVQVASASRLVCGVHQAGHVVCTGSTKDDWSSSAAPYPSDKRFEEISVGEDFVCGITTDQDVACWGGKPATTTVPEGLKAISLADNME